MLTCCRQGKKNLRCFSSFIYLFEIITQYNLNTHMHTHLYKHTYWRLNQQILKIDKVTTDASLSMELSPTSKITMLLNTPSIQLSKAHYEI